MPLGPRRFQEVLLKVRRRAVVLYFASVTARTLSLALLVSGLVFMIVPGAVLSSGRVLLTVVGLALPGSLLVSWRRRPSTSSLAAKLDRTLQCDELLSTALYCGRQLDLPAASVDRVTAHGTAVLVDVRLRSLMPPHAHLDAFGLLASGALCLGAFALAAPASPEQLTADGATTHPPTDRLQANTGVDHWPQSRNKPPPVTETLKLAQNLAREAERAPNSEEIRPRARQLSAFVLHHLSKLRSDPSAGRVADFLTQVPGVDDLSDAVRRGDWIRFQAAIQQHVRHGASETELAKLLTHARSVAHADDSASSGDIVSQAITEALSELHVDAARSDTALRTSSSELPLPGRLTSAREREASRQAGQAANNDVYPPSPLPRNDLAHNAPRSETPLSASTNDMFHRQAHLRSSELEQLEEGSNRHPADLSPQRRSHLEHATQGSLAVQQRRLNRALETLRLLAGGDASNANVGAEVATATPALAEGASTARSDNNPHASDGEQSGASGPPSRKLYVGPVRTQEQRVRAPLHVEAPLSAGLPGRHASEFGRESRAAPAAERGVPAPERVLPLAHSPVPDEYRAQISRYFSPE